MQKPFEVRRDRFLISTDPAQLEHDVIADMLTRAYWASGRPRERTERALQNSLVFGLYDGEKQIGVARVVTDYAIFAYLCDVFILEDYRGKGIANWLMETILAHPDLQGLRRILLMTSDAHGLYAKFGFEPVSAPQNIMEIFNG